MDTGRMNVRKLAPISFSKPGVARIYYQMVAKRASGDLQRQAIERLDALRTAPR